MKLAASRVKVIVLIVVAFCVALGVLTIIAGMKFQLVTYKGKDMEPTISENETIVIANGVGNIQRGDMVLFKYPADQSQRFIKRVVGLPSEVIEVREGRIFVDQKPLEERYVDAKLATSRRSIAEYRIPPGTYYVLGDNRDASNDSRYWGPLSVGLIYGRVMFK